MINRNSFVSPAWMTLDAFMTLRNICVLALLIFPSVFVLVPMTSGQTVFISLTSMYTVTGEVTRTSTSFTEFPNRTVTTVKQLYLEGRLAPAQGTNNCSSDHYPLSSLGEGLNVQFSFASDSPMDLYILSESTFSVWAGSGAHCVQVMNPLVEEHEVTQLSSRNFTIPTTGEYEVLVVNTSSGAWGDYVITVEYPASTVESQSSAIFFVTMPTTITSSYVLNQEATIFHPSMMNRIIDIIPTLLVVAFAVVIVDLLRREIMKRRKKPEHDRASAAKGTDVNQ